MEGNSEIVFYDIASAPPKTCYAPSPWKTRYALNFKSVNYRTAWVELPDVKRTRQELGVPPCRFFADGESFYTLPMIKDLSTGQLVGDTFDIAVYLDKQHPDKPRLIPARSIAVFRAFNTQIDAIFSSTVLLWCHGLPFNPATVEVSQAEFCKRAKVDHWDQLTVKGEERKKLLADSKVRLGELAELYLHPDGPFLEGEEATYADIIVGGWLKCMSKTLPRGDWEEITNWHDGRWGKIHSALEKYAEVR